MISVRAAGIEDASGIATVLENAFEDDSLGLANVDYYRAYLAGEEHKVFVAERDGQVLGVIGCFVTTVSGMVARWEMDLIGVHPNHQRERLGLVLLTTAEHEARQHKQPVIKFMRGLIRTDNAGSKRLFESAGFSPGDTRYNLYVWQPQAVNPTPSAQVGLIQINPVDTLTYRGVWIEGMEGAFISDEQRAVALTYARHLAAVEGRKMASALIPTEQPLPEWLLVGATLLGQYQWWRKS